MATFTSHVDSVDVNHSLVVVGLSALEGNVWDGGLQILHAENGEMIAGRKCPSGMAMVRFLGASSGNASDSIIGTACDDSFIRLYRPNNDDIELIQEWEGHESIVSAIAYHPEESNLFASAGWDGNIHLWDLEAGKDTSRPVYTLDEAHHGAINDIAFSKLSSEPWRLASVGNDHLLRIWDKRLPPNHGCIQLYKHDNHAPVSCVEWSTGIDYSLYTGTDHGDIHTFDLRKLHDPLSTKAYGIHTNRVRRMRSVLSQRSGEEYLLSGGDDCTLILSSIHSSATRFLTPPPPLLLTPPPGMSTTTTPTPTTTIPEPPVPSSHTGIRVQQKVKEHSDYIADLVVFSHDHDLDTLTVITASTDNTIRLIDITLPVTMEDDREAEEEGDAMQTNST